MNKNDREQFSIDPQDDSLKELVLKTRDVWRYFLPRWLIILVSCIVGGLLGLAVAVIKRPVYIAELNFALQGQSSGGGGLSAAIGLASQFGVDIGGGDAGDEFSGDNLIELLKTRAMVESTLLANVPGKNETLAELYISSNKLREDWDEAELKNGHYPPNADRLKFSRKQDSLLQIISEKIVKKDLFVEKVDSKLSIVKLKVNAKNELFAKYFAETLEKKVSDYYVFTKTDKENKNVSVLQRQTDSIRRELNSAISGVALSTEVNPNPNGARQTLHVPSLRRQVDVQANTIILGELVKNLEITKMSLLEETPIVHVIDWPILPLRTKELDKILGLVLGVLIGAFLSIIFLSVKRRYRRSFPVIIE